SGGFVTAWPGLPESIWVLLYAPCLKYQAVWSVNALAAHCPVGVVGRSATWPATAQRVMVALTTCTRIVTSVVVASAVTTLVFDIPVPDRYSRILGWTGEPD